MSYYIFDAHCDTIGKILDNKKDLISNDLHFDTNRALSLKNGYVQVFAAYASGENSFNRVIDLIDKYFYVTQKNKNIIHCTSFSELEQFRNHNKILSLLSIEGGDCVYSLEMLRVFYRIGVRILTLTWNNANKISDGILEKRGAGLTAFGIDVVKEMNRLGMAVDVSHISEKGFWDVAENSNKPFIASHSNSKVICKNPRNLSDSQINEIIRQNGCIGVNFYPVFLCENKNSTIRDVIKHIEHILSLGGENNVGFGSDFDGIDSLPEGISGVQDYEKIINEFLKLGYNETLIQKICSDNFLSVLKKIFTV